MTKLLSYLVGNGIAHNFFAEKVKTSQPTLNRILRKGHIPSLKLALAIEKQTKGEVTVYDWLNVKDENNDKPKKTQKKKPGKINK